MIKTQNVLHEKTLIPELDLQVVNLPVQFYGTVGAVDVRLTQREGETYFKFLPKKGRSAFTTEVDSVPLRMITDAFLALESPAAAKQFFERYGELGMNDSKERRRNTLKWSEILAFQKMLRQAWDTDFRRWDDEIKWSVFGLTFRPDMRFEHPSLFFEANCVKDFLLADLSFAVLSGLPAGFCARKDCGKLFQKHTKHERKFCSTECAHIESVRQHRARMSKKRGK